MKWKKKGQILDFADPRKPGWMDSYAQNPAAIVQNDRIRVFFNTRAARRNNEQIALPGYIDLDKKNLDHILDYSREPLLELGGRGCFDEFGIMSSSVVRYKSELRMYYVGWTRLQSVPYNWAIGLAISKDDGRSFQRAFQGPIVGALQNEPFLQNGCYVMQDPNGIWHMWYSTGQEWLETESKMESRYAIVHATSTDGIDWVRNGQTILPFRSPDETQTTPTIFEHNSVYHMLFSYRNSIDFRGSSGGYRIGYAWSSDLCSWTRDDSKGGIDVSEQGWDSEMICYPSVFELEGQLILLYSGNYFGKIGFGYAELDYANGTS